MKATIRDMHRGLGKPRTFQVVFFMLALLMPATFLRAAELVFSPASGSYAAESDFSIKVDIDPKSEKVNAADGSITFDKDTASVVSISKESSVFSLWTADPSFSNSAGTIEFSGGSPAGFTTKGTVLTIKFKAKKAGAFTASFTKGSILAADGKGTDVYVKGVDGTYTITDAAPAGDEAAEEGAVASEGTPPAPTIASLTHPKPDSWYGTSTVDFSWKITPDITEVRTILSDKEVAIPNVSQPMTVSSQKVLDVKDGTWYVFVQFKNDLGWGEVGQRAIRIDTVQPDEFDFSLSEGETPRFVFSTEDSLSGVDRYEIMIGGSAAGTVKAADLGEGYPVPVQAGGPQSVTIKAIDKAGNIREVKKELTLPAVAKKGKVEEEVAKESPWTIELFVMILFALIIGAVASWNVYVRKMAAQEKLRILQQVSVVRDKNDKIFSAMREEFEEMVNDLDEQPQLTPRERDFMERMSEALEISEELVDSGLEELKKTIRG